jgi:hypothetical protein
VSVPKKHHFVPKFLLRNFADTRGQLIVHRMDQHKSYPTNVVNIGHQNFGHSLFWPDREPDHVSLEARMNAIEDAAATVITRLRQSTARTLTDEEREVLGFLIALQWSRSRFLLMVMRRHVLGRDTPIDNTNRSLGLLNIVTNALYPWEARANNVFDPKERACPIADRLYGWKWRAYRPTADKLVIADNVVSMWGVAAGETGVMPEAWARHGVGLGFGNCARITVPLAPNLGLVITRPGQDRRRNVTAAAFNQATVYNSREFVAHHPAGLTDKSLQLALDENIQTQRWLLPVILEGSRP